MTREQMIAEAQRARRFVAAVIARLNDGDAGLDQPYFLDGREMALLTMNLVSLASIADECAAMAEAAPSYEQLRNARFALVNAQAEVNRATSELESIVERIAAATPIPSET